MLSTITPCGRFSRKKVTRSSCPLRWIRSNAGTVCPEEIVNSSASRLPIELTPLVGPGPCVALAAYGSRYTKTLGFCPSLILPKLLTSFVASSPFTIAVAVTFVIAALVSFGSGASVAALRVPLASLCPASISSGVETENPGGNPPRSTLISPSNPSMRSTFTEKLCPLPALTVGFAPFNVTLKSGFGSRTARRYANRSPL